MRVLPKDSMRMSSCFITSLVSFLLILASSPLRLCIGEDRLTMGRSISGNQTIISDVGSFALGFFSPGNSSDSQYLGIWYNKIPEQTVVWIANRDAALAKNSDGVFALTNDGNLVILEGEKLVWTSNVSYVGAIGSNSTAILDNTGNLILRDSKGTVLWQSFDYPTDTMLPGMKFGFNMKSRHNHYLKSWEGGSDPSTGAFKFGFDPRGPMQFLTWHKSYPYWRSDVWDGSVVTTLASTSDNYVVPYATYTMTDDGFYISFGVSDNSMLSRLVLNRSGRMEFSLWQEDNMKWLVIWAAPGDQCDIYGWCGPFGSCDVKQLPWICKCLTGFKPKVQNDWDRGDWSGGCVRKMELRCNEEDTFVMFGGIKLPDNSISLENLTMTQCEIECRRNCSCTAYAYADASVWKTSRCIYWVENLIDVKHKYNGGHDLYIRLSSFKNGSKSHGKMAKKHSIFIATTAAAMGFLLIGALICSLLIRSFKKRKMGETSVRGIKFGASNTMGNRNSAELISFSFSRILTATGGFSVRNKLGEGGYGPVYRGSLPKGLEIAVKRLSKSSCQGLEEFMNEVTLIARLQHKNLVRLLGCCIEKEEKMLIYEYLPNKSLDKFLFDPQKRVNLDWRVRFQIIEGIAQGLLYLHKYSRLRIIHRDLKASNILLDNELNPKISDFGMARIFEGNETEANTGRVVGTYGYMSPEYALNGLFSEKSDVFSFGVLLIEIVSSKRNSGFYASHHALNLLGYAWDLWRQERALELMDQSIKGSCNKEEVLKCIQIGLLCVQEDSGARPTMSTVVFMLGDSNENLPLPKEPAFFVGRSYSNVHGGVSLKNFSINEVTISNIEPR